MSALRTRPPEPADRPARKPPRRRWAGRIPRAGIAVALIAFANLLAWGLIIPPYHVPDEPSHQFYVEYLAETGKLPEVSPDYAWYSGEINGALSPEAFYSVIGEPANRPVPEGPAERRLERSLATGGDRVGVGDASSASSNPPLYYLLQVPVYGLFHGADVLDRLAAMRAFAALLGALSVLCIYLFLRELLPRSPLAWAVGALCAAFQPLFAFVDAGVNNDGGLILVSAALLLAIARTLRRGLTARRAIALGVLLGLGVLMKSQALAYAPAVALALLIAAWRRPPRALRSLAAAAAGFAVPIGIYGIVGATVWNRPLFDRVSDVTSAAPSGVVRPFQIREQLSYLWQEYLPRLPFMTDVQPEVPPYDRWFQGFVGRFGWLDFGFQDWVSEVAAGVWIIVAVAACVELWRRRDALRRRLGESAVYALFAAGLAAAIGVASYRAWLNNGGVFEQPRYLLPLLPLYAAIVALAVRAFGRYAAIAGVLLVVGAAGHGIAAQLLTLARYYG
jgi:4-amino-4-deoxy-L-arabinose transferase-like glycosyltransferase